jgi:hypothetical protein
MQITKADGSQEAFDIRKLEYSLRRAGAHKDEIPQIVSDVSRTLVDGARTQDIYQRAFQLLRETELPVAAKYSLRRAVFNLGPTGFPFEDFLGKIFEAQGYTTKRRLIIKGKCATHEIDLAAYSPQHSFVAEAKFHAHPGVKSDLQVAMYSYARYLDLQNSRVCKGDMCGIVSLYVITNTKFTEAAIKYGSCVGINLLSWDYPKNNSLHSMIEKLGVYPITVLTRLTSGQKQRLLQNGIILCSDILKNTTYLRELGLSESKIATITAEASQLCNLT